ncbi:MAG: hypothetical protein NC483_05120, partial [Ruminococcus sp.]|nr:hypothetical protein [Ruminococcus sp.]
MKFETLKTGKYASYKRSILIVSCVSLVLLLTVSLYYSFAKYRVTQTVSIVEGVVTKSKKKNEDITVAVYWGEKQQATFPAKTSGYHFDRVVCDVDSIANDATWSDEAWSLNMEVTQPVNCTVYFSYTPKMTIQLSGNYDSKSVTVTANFDSTNAFAVKNYYYKIDDAAYPDYQSSTSNSFTFTNLSLSKNYTVQVYAIDAENNRTETLTSNIWVDSKAPSISFAATAQEAGTNGWYKKYEMDVKAEDADNNITEFKYCITSSESCEPTTEGTLSGSRTATYNHIFQTSESTQKVCAKATDGAGNSSSTICSSAYKVDKTKPTISIDASTNGKTLTVSASGSDVGSKNLTYYFSTDSGTNYTSQTSNVFTKELESGTYVVKAYVVDAAGNQSDVKESTVTISAGGNSTITGNTTDGGVRTGGAFNTPYVESNNKLYQTTDDDGTSYYFAGNPTNNWVKFGGYYWRIIRINGDGSIRMIYQGTAANTTGTGTQIGTSAFNSSYNNNMYVGYFYTSNQLRGLGTASTIYTALNNWFASSNIKQGSAYFDKIDPNAGFCGDRTPSSTNTPTVSNGLNTGDGKGGTGTTTTYYGAYLRLAPGGVAVTSSTTTVTPSLNCPDSSDLYTYSGANQGNKKLANPVGLITADEVAYGGLVVGSYSSGNYLDIGQDYWTAST